MVNVLYLNLSKAFIVYNVVFQRIKKKIKRLKSNISSRKFQYFQVKTL